MLIRDFNNTVLTQMDRCKDLLLAKGAEYAPGSFQEPQNEPRLVEEASGQLCFNFELADRLAHFKKAAVIMGSTPKAALLGMLTKHLVSVSDMCTDGREYSLQHWNEKITDSINYLLILRAIIAEEKNEYEQN